VADGAVWLVRDGRLSAAVRTRPGVEP